MVGHATRAWFHIFQNTRFVNSMSGFQGSRQCLNLRRVRCGSLESFYMPVLKGNEHLTIIFVYLLFESITCF